MNWMANLLKIFKKKNEQVDDVVKLAEQVIETKEMNDTIDDAKEMEKNTFKASDAIGLVNERLENASKKVDSYVKNRIKEIERNIKYYSSNGYTKMVFEPCRDFPYSFIPGGMEYIQNNIYETIKKDFENRGFIIQPPNAHDRMRSIITWAKTEEKRAEELLR